MFLVNSLRNFLYPPVCMGCQSLIDADDRNTVCANCFESLQLLDPKERCPRCFRHLIVHNRCPAHASSALKAVAASFEDSPLVNALLASDRELIAPFLLLQHQAMRWPLPDLIMPTPGDRFCKQNALRTSLTRSLAAYMQRPFKPLLGLHRQLLPFPLLSLEEQPAHLSPRAVIVHHPELVINSNILLIQDSLATHHPGILAAQALITHGAQSVRLLCVTAPSSD